MQAAHTWDSPAWAGAALGAARGAGAAAGGEVCTRSSSGIYRGCSSGARGCKQLPFPSCSGHSAWKRELEFATGCDRFACLWFHGFFFRDSVVATPNHPPCSER